MLWISDNEGYFTERQIIDFATSNGWEFVQSTKFSRQATERWNYDRKMIFPLSDRGFDPNVRVNDHTYSNFPRWITGDIELLEFKTGWVIVTPGTGKSNLAFGYVLINKDKNKMSVYHLWGE